MALTAKMIAVLNSLPDYVPALAAARTDGEPIQLGTIIERLEEVSGGIVARVASTANRALTGLTAIDGVTPVSGDVVLLKDQTDQTQNGLYVAEAGTWTRLKDAHGADVVDFVGLSVRVAEGTTQADTGWLQTNNAPIVVGTDNLVWVQTVTSGASSLDLASTSNGKGASLIGIEDAGSLIVATTVEAALAELKTVAKWKAGALLTIATGAITRTQFMHKVDTEAAAASDDLDTITGGGAGDLLLIRANDDTHSVVVKHLTGNIVCPTGQDITLAEDDDYALLAREGTNWTVIAFKTLAANGGGLGAHLASVATSKGASSIGIEDAAALITGTNVETALLELVKYVPVTLADVGTGQAIPVTRSVSMAITQNGAETNSLAIPTFRGQTMEFWVDTDTSGARVITSAQRINQAGNTIMTLSDVGDFIKLRAITIAGALRWQVVANDGVVLS